MAGLTEGQLTELFNGYNNNNQLAVENLISWFFGGASTSRTFTGTTIIDGDLKTNSIKQRTTAGMVLLGATEKLAAFGGTPVVIQDVSSQAFTPPTDEATLITQVTYLQTVVNNIRTALGQTKYKLVNVTP